MVREQFTRDAKRLTRSEDTLADSKNAQVWLASGSSSQTMVMTLPRGAKAARLARMPLMSSFHQATTTRLASLAAISSSEDSARSIACTAESSGKVVLHITLAFRCTLSTCEARPTLPSPSEESCHPGKQSYGCSKRGLEVALDASRFAKSMSLEVHDIRCFVADVHVPGAQINCTGKQVKARPSENNCKGQAESRYSYLPVLWPAGQIMLCCLGIRTRHAAGGRAVLVLGLAVLWPCGLEVPCKSSRPSGQAKKGTLCTRALQGLHSTLERMPSLRKRRGLQ